MQASVRLRCLFLAALQLSVLRTDEAVNYCLDVDQGFDRFEPKIKKIVIACLVAMFISCAEIVFTMLLFPKQLWYCIGIIILLIARYIKPAD